MSTPYYEFVISGLAWAILFWRFKSKRVTIINLSAIALYIDYLLDTGISLQNTNMNIALWKITRSGDHHMIDMLGIIGSLFILAIIFYKNPKTKTLYGVFAFFTNFTMIGLHELGWYISYDINVLIQHNPFNVLWILYSYFDVYVIVIAAYVFFALKFKVFVIPYRTIIILSIFYAFWVSIGFPVSIGYYGHTIYYYNIDVNIIEIISWLVPIFAFLVEQIRYINPSTGIWLSQKVRPILPKTKHIITLETIPLIPKQNVHRNND